MCYLLYAQSCPQRNFSMLLLSLNIQEYFPKVSHVQPLHSDNTALSFKTSSTFHSFPIYSYPTPTPSPSALEQRYFMLKNTDSSPVTNPYVYRSKISTTATGPHSAQGTNRTRPDENSKKSTKSQSYTICKCLEILSAPAQAHLLCRTA